MIKVFYIFSILITFLVFQNLKADDSLKINLRHASNGDKAFDEVHPLAHNWNANLKLFKFNNTQEKKLREAISLIKKVITSKEFRDRILSYKSPNGPAFVDNQGLSNEEIYLKILEGAEQIGNTTKNNMMDVELELYHQSTNTIGYTYPHTTKVWINEKYFSRYRPVKVADNLMHEWMHKLGFTHAIKWSKERDHSVPYAVGSLVEELASRIAD